MTKYNKEELVSKLKLTFDELSNSLVSVVDKFPLLGSPVEKVKTIIEGLIKDIGELPRICVIGNTGVGKSSFINHLLDAKIARTNAVWSETQVCESYKYPNDKNPICEIIDTRGLGEILKSDEAEKQLINDLTVKRPHLIIYIVDLVTKANINRQLQFLKQLLNYCEQNYNREVGCLILANKADGIAPSSIRLEDIEDYKNLNIDREELNKKKINIEAYEAKIRNIQEKLALLNKALEEEGLNQNRSNEYLIKILPMRLRWDENKIFFWNKKEILNELFKQSPENVLLAFAEKFANSDRLEKIYGELADKVIYDFSWYCGELCVNPTPVPDASFLVPLQIALVKIIEILRLYENCISAEKLIFLVNGPIKEGGKALASYFLKLTGWGQVINIAIAGTVTYALGQVAKAYYIYGLKQEDIVDYFKKIISDKSTKEKFEKKRLS